MTEMPLSERMPDVVRDCWRDGFDPETIMLRKFCHWCHHKKPKHDPECPVLEVIADRARVEALEPLARHGERQLLREYEDEAGIESILSMTRGIPSAHRSFEAFKAERLATLAKESSEDTPMASDHDWSPGDP